MNTPFLDLYLPNGNERVLIADSLASNFRKIDDAFKNGNGVDYRMPFLNVTKYGAVGDYETDCTQAFNDAINDLPSGGVLYVPPGGYMINGVGYDVSPDFPTGGIKMKDNIMMFAYGARLIAIPNNSRGYCVVNFTNCLNSSIRGAKVEGERYDHTNSSDYVNNQDQWGNGVMFVGATNCGAVDVDVTGANGDGFYIGANKAGVTTKNPYLIRCNTLEARRNGLSVTSVDGGFARDCVFEGTIGTSPECGVDLEPNPGKIVKGMKFINCVAKNNNQHGFLFGSIQNDTRSAQDCIFIGNEAYGNVLSGFYNNRTDRITFIGNVAHDNGNNGFAQVSTVVGSYVNDNVYENNIAYNNKYYGFMIGDGKDGIFDGNYAYDNAKQGVLNTYSNIHLYNTSGMSVMNNKARMTSGGKVQYGMYILANCSYLFVTNNDCYNGGIAGFNNASSTTVKGAGNRGLNGTFSTADFI